MKRLFKEPLLHFLLLGATIFAIYHVVARPGGAEPGKIVISQAQISTMAVGFTRTWQRPPSPEELEGLIRDRVQEEVYCREAMALGLDKDDTVIRRRLRQKMEFVSDDVAAVAEPTDEELNACLKAHADAFRVQRQFTFRHVYLNPALHGENLARDVAELLAQLQQGGAKADDLALGDPFLLEHRFEGVAEAAVRQQFGEKFATELGKVVTGEWQGPVESGYGVHLVFVKERTEGRLPALAEVRDAVQRDWTNARRQETNGKFYADLLKRYEVTIERPRAADEKRIAEAKAK